MYGGQTDVLPQVFLPIRWGDRAPSLVAVVYYQTIYLSVDIFSYVVIMSVHGSTLINIGYFLRCLKGVNDFFLSVNCILIFVVYACGHIGSR